MGADNQQEYATERRTEKREPSKQYYSVEFTLTSIGSRYQFKLWNISTNGMCILVKKNSIVLEHLQVDDILEMTYYIADAKGVNERLKTQVKHITPNPDGRFQGHCLIGLAIL